MLTIYSIPLSLYCAKLRILLRYKNLAWEEAPPPGGYGSDEYKQIVPSGNLPSMQDGDLIIADSEAIAEYLNEKHPDPPMLSADLESRAKERELSRFHDTRLEQEVRRLFSQIAPDRRDPSIVKSQTTAINVRLEQLSEMLVGRESDSDDLLVLGDCGFPITFAWIEALVPALGLDVEMPDRVAAYYNRIARHPAIKTELEDYQPKLAQWLNLQATP